MSEPKSKIKEIIPGMKIATGEAQVAHTVKFDPQKHIIIKEISLLYHPNTKTKIREAPNLVQYETQHFNCKVTFEVLDCFVENHWTIGLIQACDKMFLENRYGQHGSTLWEFHPLKSERCSCVNDSDGRQYPFYSFGRSKIEMKRGKRKHSSAQVSFEDHFYPTVAWSIINNPNAKLTDITREQDFYVWFAAIKRGNQPSRQDGSYEFFDSKHDSVHVLKTMRWRFNIHLEFDTSQPLGHRIKSIEDKQRELPYIMKKNFPIPLSALMPPHCNAAQSLIWYPSDPYEDPKLLVPPKLTIVEWDQWCYEMVKKNSNHPHLNHQVQALHRETCIEILFPSY